MFGAGTIAVCLMLSLVGNTMITMADVRAQPPSTDRLVEG